ncbi:hypothetical protein CF392_01080 [Tamilnaduibacter salinus]|uniref:MSHA biogenesis protein MshP n=1 Tax=Tamilnaduibacter salinus TaxID=1484056 RepID=A0A2A2I8B7_9GAMM|nr:hypothetical protein [Tamilnaduibacter salinus]PAV27303.1 hypothetical protein CF392_01080 [Tamilnaduibacter salinus]
MCPDRSSLSRERGAGLPVALFVITVLALIVAGMAQLQQGTGASVSRQILSQRAFLAAESGAQASVAKTLASGDCSVDGSTLSFSASGLAGCEAGIVCESAQADIDGGPAPETVFTITSQGACGTGSEAVSRTVEVRVR